MKLKLLGKHLTGIVINMSEFERKLVALAERAVEALETIVEHFCSDEEEEEDEG